MIHVLGALDFLKTHAQRTTCAKFGAFGRSVTIISLTRLTIVKHVSFVIRVIMFRPGVNTAKVNKLFSFFSSRCFLVEIENMFFVFLSSHRSRKSCGNTRLSAHVPTAFVFLLNN